LLVAALVALGAIAFSWGPEVEHRYARVRWANFLVGDPHHGSHLFREKGCAHCHTVNGVGGGRGPELGFERAPHSNMNQLVSAMWNHAPRMWERMRAENVPYPDFDYDEMAHLFAYLYTARYVDEAGNVQAAANIFESSRGRCHDFYGNEGKVGPSFDLGGQCVHAHCMVSGHVEPCPAMEAEMQRQGLVYLSFATRK
jgi:cytochrome c2